MIVRADARRIFGYKNNSNKSQKIFSSDPPMIYVHFLFGFAIIAKHPLKSEAKVIDRRIVFVGVARACFVGLVCLRARDARSVTRCVPDSRSGQTSHIHDSRRFGQAAW